MNLEFQFQFLLKNFKCFEDTSISVNDFNILMVEGDNETGKTSLITAIQEAYMGKSLTPEPLRRGEEKGEKTMTVKDRNGDPVTVKHTFTKNNQKGSFIAYDKDGKPYKTIKAFQELLGVYHPVTVQDFFNDAKNIDGRRKILKNYIIPLLTPGEQDELELINAQIKPNTGTIYVERTANNSQLKSWGALMNNNKLTPDEVEVLEQEETARSLLEQCKAKKEDIVKNSYSGEKLQVELNNLNEKHTDLVRGKQETVSEHARFVNESIEEENRIKKQIQELQQQLKEKESTRINRQNLHPDVLDACDKTISDVSEKIKAKKKEIAESNVEENEAKILELTNRIDKGEKIIEQISAVKVKKENYDQYKAKHDEFSEKVAKNNSDISRLQTRRSEIFSSKNIPNGIVVTEDDFTMEGFDFADTQLSYSKAALAIADLIFKTNDCNLLVMGNAGEWGQKRLHELGELAREHGNRTVVLTRVADDQSEVKVVGMVNPLSEEKVQENEEKQHQQKNLF